MKNKEMRYQSAQDSSKMEARIDDLQVVGETGLYVVRVCVFYVCVCVCVCVFCVCVLCVCGCVGVCVCVHVCSVCAV